MVGMAAVDDGDDCRGKGLVLMLLVVGGGEGDGV